jgi:hypothetical protein
VDVTYATVHVIFATVHVIYATVEEWRFSAASDGF